MKGIILAGGAGTRLYPLTKIITKQLQPVYEKPMIYYPLSTLMLCGIKEILLITTSHDLPHFQNLLGTGEELGLKISYKIQLAPNGLAEAFILGEEFIGNDDATLILGDNLFYGDYKCFRAAIQKHNEKKDGMRGRVFAYKVTDPERYGVVEFDKTSGAVLSIEEKPKHPKSNWALPGLYIFDNSVVKRAKDQKPSPRGELEIVDLMKSYLADKQLAVETLSRGIAWLDTGTPQALLEASQFVGAIEQRQGLKIACIEEVAYRMKFINKEQFAKVITNYPKSPYRDYLQAVFDETI